MQLLILPDGQLRCVYDEAIDLAQLGQLSLRRGSWVEPDSQGHWHADLGPVAGPRLGPYALRSQALRAEHTWLENHWLTNPSSFHECALFPNQHSLEE